MGDSDVAVKVPLLSKHPTAPSLGTSALKVPPSNALSPRGAQSPRGDGMQSAVSSTVLRDLKLGHRKIAGVLEPPINLSEPLCTGVFELHADPLTKAVRWLCAVMVEQHSTLVHIDTSLRELQEDVQEAHQLVEANHTVVSEKIDKLKEESEEMIAKARRMPDIHKLASAHTLQWDDLEESPGEGESSVTVQQMGMGVAAMAHMAGKRFTRKGSALPHQGKLSFAVAGLAARFVNKTRDRIRKGLDEASTEGSPRSADDDGDEDDEYAMPNESPQQKHMVSSLRKSMHQSQLSGSSENLDGLSGKLTILNSVTDDMPVALVALYDDHQALLQRVAEMEHRQHDSDKGHQSDTIHAVKRDVESHKRWQRKMEQQLQHQEKAQQQKDLAQDELLQMELNSLRQMVQSRMSVADFEKAREAVLARSEENTAAFVEGLRAELSQNLQIVHDQSDNISKAITRQIAELEEQISNNVKLDAEREEEVNRELSDLRDLVHASEKSRADEQAAQEFMEQQAADNASLIKRVELLEKQTKKMVHDKKHDADDEVESPNSPRGRKFMQMQSEIGVQMKDMQSDFALQLKEMQEAFASQISQLKLQVETATGQSRQQVSRGNMSASQNSLGNTPAGSRATTASAALKRPPRSRDGGIESQSSDNLSWLAEKMNRFANADKEREKLVLETMSKLLPELEQLPEKVTKLGEELEQLAEHRSSITNADLGTELTPAGTPLAAAPQSRGSRNFLVSPSSKPPGTATSCGDAFPGLPRRLSNLLEGEPTGLGGLSLDVEQELERFRRLFEYLESVVPKDAQQAIRFFLGEEWRSGDKQAVKSGGDVESESRLDTKLQLTEDALRREVANVMNVVKSTQRDTLGNGERLIKLERLIPSLMSKVEALQRPAAQAHAFPEFATTERMASRERTSTASRGSRPGTRGTPTTRLRSNSGAIEEPPRIGTPLGQARLSTPHPFVSQRGLVEGLDGLRSDVRSWLETLRDGIMSHLRDKADSSQVAQMAAQIAAAEDELQVLPRCVQGLGFLTQMYQKETSPRENAKFLAKHSSGSNFCASCESPLPATAGEWRVVTPVTTSHSRFPQRALPDLPKGLKTMQKTTSLPMLQSGTSGDRSRTAG
eukprot:gnl/MRDRNA2_/MRDRNA2_132403_c0_seq1.p1 gnl/MRDRNA2_/MRDRNA2_132403_c0~~gnl/MRDRNA2_/MRDRNA2_132403_c0_seq1.p1  ORF type:complete len:1136 (-),score=256.49 gnl/MRDRNA2_/MRDRNA2_132403_c0_seq1:242-3601(-)